MDHPMPHWTFDPAAEGFPRPGLRRLRRARLRKALLGAAGLLAVTAAGASAFRWWQTTRFMVSTDDAYLQSDSVTVSPQVAGTIAELDVTDNQKVRAGQVLARIDDRPFRAAVAKAEADVAAAEGKLENIAAEIAQQGSNVAGAGAVIAADRAALGFAEADATRYARLLQTGFGTAQTAERTTANLREQQANLVRDQAALTAAEQQIGVLRSQRAMAAAALKANQAVLTTAELNLSYTVIEAPVAGVVGARGVRLGAYVSPGTPLLQVVPMGAAIYVTANFKETDLARMVDGEPVRLSIDTFPGHSFRGTVQSLAPGSGSQFALLPPENATGNFTKIVQRVPVKIRLAADDPLLNRLRPGLSVEASVNTAAAPADQRTALAEESAR
jgi:membrane fusion protein, multidrug efflux system